MTDKPETVADVLADERKCAEAADYHYTPADLKKAFDRIERALSAQPSAEPAYDRGLIADMLEGMAARRHDYLPGSIAEQVRLLRAPEGGARTVSKKKDRDTVSLSTAVTLIAATADMYKPAKASGSAPDVSEALAYSRNYATANPLLSKTAAEHILGLCDLLEKHAATPSASTPQPEPKPADDRVPILWRQDTPLGRGYSASKEFYAAFPDFPNPPKPAVVEVTEEMVERAAVGIHEYRRPLTCRAPLDEQDDGYRARVRGQARAALTAALQEGKSHG